MKAIVAILSAALVALGVGSISLWHQLDASRQQIADLMAQFDTATASARQVTTIAPSPSLPLAEPTAVAPTAAPATDADRNALAVKAEVERLQAMMQIRRSPESNAQIKTAMIGMMSNQYPDVGKALGLSREEVDRLLNLLYDQENRGATMDPLGRDAALTARLRQTEKDELSSLLGSKYAKWQEYKTELPTRRLVKDLAAALDAEGMPLSDAKNNSLIQTLVAEERRNRQSYESTHGHTSSDPSISAQINRFTPEANRNLLNAASAYLSPQQMETYSQVLERASSKEAVTRSRMIQALKNAEAIRRGQP